MNFITPMYVPLVAVTTLCTIIFIGLGFMRSPSRSGALWGTALLSAVVASYGWAAADVLDLVSLRAASSGLLLAGLALMWSGVRAHRGKRQHLGVSIAWTIVVPAALLMASATDVYDTVFRIVFVLTGVFPSLTIVELVQMRPLVHDEVLPMLTVSGLFLVFSVIVILEGILTGGQGSGSAGFDSLTFLRTINTVSAVVFLVSVTTTMLLLTRTEKRDSPDTRSVGFDLVAADRLARAEAAQDPWWSLIDIRLDDPDELCAMSGGTAFAAISDRLAADIRRVLPADADIERTAPVHFVALVPRAQGDMRTLLTNLLECVSRVGPEQAAPIRLTVSIGWAQVIAVGYDLTALATAAAEAAVTAYESGGDRWERVRAKAQ